MKSTFSKQNFEQERAMNFFKVATKIFSFLYCSFLKLKQLLAIMKMFQRSILQKNTILLEVIQSKQNLAQLSFYFLLSNKLQDKNISKTNESIPLK